MKQKVGLVLGIAVAACVLALVVGQTADAALGEHDISSNACGSCHTPHNTTITEGPLWVQTLTTQTFTLYSSTTLDATMAQPTGSSKLCLSCHDGVTVIVATGLAMGAGPHVVGTDLSNDHPVSFTYDSALATLDGELVDPSADGDTDGETVGASTPYLPLVAGELHCYTCHNPHDNTNADFLRIANTASAVCLKCHVK